MPWLKIMPIFYFLIAKEVFAQFVCVSKSVCGGGGGGMGGWWGGGGRRKPIGWPSPTHCSPSPPPPHPPRPPPPPAYDASMRRYGDDGSQLDVIIFL